MQFIALQSMMPSSWNPQMRAFAAGAKAVDQKGEKNYTGLEASVTITPADSLTMTTLPGSGEEEDARNSEDGSSSSVDCETPGSSCEQLVRPPVPKRAASRLLLRTSFKEFSSVVSIVVGDGKAKNRPETRYLVHKELCTAASPFFAAALNGNFAETRTQSVHLPDERPEIFEWFLQWLYTGSLLSARSAKSSGCSGGGLRDMYTEGELLNRAGRPRYFLLLDIWALADRLLVRPLCNLVLTTMAQLSESTNSVPTPSDTWMLYDRMAENAGLRNLIVDLFAYLKTDGLLDTHQDDWHPRFLRDLVVKLKRPGPEALQRHTFVEWTARTWPAARACEDCRKVQRPNEVTQKCGVCEKVFCLGCVRRHGDAHGWTVQHDMLGCKPWAGANLCRFYHDHRDGKDRG
nr:hypothetical protein CFP56_63716 [Quercus suber]